jgi:bicarbonate transport system ATP-binding protein
MSIFVAVEQVDKAFALVNGDRYLALQGIDLQIKKGEFVSLIGHSGCGKSTLLNIIAGLSQPSRGLVTLEGRRIRQPGPDRMVVFQNYSLLPWRTVRDNIALAVNAVLKDRSPGERRQIIEHHIDLVGLRQAADKRPAELSGGMKQRVAIARALAIRPQVLILDEPFGALDAITKEELQEELLKIWSDHRCTVLMITHDIDEALFLADRLVMMTNGPAAQIGEVLNIPFPRLRNRERMMEDPQYYKLRNYALDFLYHRFAHDEIS